MINYNNNNISEMHYSGFTIVRAYGCNGKLVYGEEPPTPPTPTGMTGYKASGTTIDLGDFAVECEEGWNELLSHDLPTASAITSIEVGTCINIIGSGALSYTSNVTSIILPATIEWLRNYTFLDGDTSIQSLTIYATTPPQFDNYVEDEWIDIFGYSYPSSKAPAGFKIYVPSESVNAYKTATGWSHMADYIQAIS